MQYRDDIDGLRAVAVILIVFFHVRLSNVPGGFIGVDVFFVISGFLITRLITKELADDRFSFAQFYMRRLRRLGPALLVTIALTLAAGWFILPPNLYETTAQSALATLFSVSNILFWQQTGYFDISAAYKPLLHTWSLAVEEQFYLVWPAALVISLGLLSKRGLLIGIIILSAVSLAVSQAMLGNYTSAAFYLTPFRMFAFGAGAILAVTGWQAGNVVIANVASLAGLLVIFYVANTLPETAPFPGINSAIPAFAAALMIYAGPTAVMNRALALAPIRYIGQISYSVYLLHWPLIVYYIFLYGQAETALQSMGLIALTLIAGAAMYHLVETPFRLKAQAGFKVSSGILGWGSLATAVIIAGASLLITTERGFPTRYAPEIRELLASLDAAIDERTQATGEFSCNATTNSQDIYFDQFESCLPQTSDNLVVVLGDSHAADVFMGLRAAYPNRAFVQMTGNGCNMTKSLAGTDFCTPFMQFWQSWLVDHADRLDAIVYSQSGASLITKGAGGIERPDAQLVEAMNTTLRQFQIGDVPFIFWGPRPAFQPTIDIAIAGSTDLDTLRNYYKDAEFGADFALDVGLSGYFADQSVHYVSSAAALCQPNCPTLTTTDELFVVDYAHWTLKGAIEAARSVVSSDPTLSALIAD